MLAVLESDGICSLGHDDHGVLHNSRNMQQLG
jgi:hypothetical protein